ncbi:MAG: hypothetical protein J2P36_02735 [Ktedonobacteraceae bacterium]|nr:hypothetical protein [Ktedonobacteraceae bacterium]
MQNIDHIHAELNLAFDHAPFAHLCHTVELYNQYYGSGSSYYHAHSVPFPGYRPRHRLLRQLTGVFPLEPALPAWWKEEVCPLIQPPELRSLLERISPADFYAGRLTGEREQQFRLLAQERSRRPEWAQSPKLGRLLKTVLPPEEGHWLISQYEQRGSSGWEPLQIMLSAHPWDVLTMGAGKSYRSCQHLIDGGERDRLPANLLDNGMLVAYVTDPTQNRWDVERMYARIIVRLLRSERGWGLLLDRGYGDPGYELALRTYLQRHFLAKGFSLWEATYPIRSQRIQFRSTFYATGPLQQFFTYDPPYLDQTAADWSQMIASSRQTYWVYMVSVREVASHHAGQRNKEEERDA